MASYAPRPDGLLEVTLDDGRVMPTALDPGTLEAQGIYAQTPAPPPPQPDLRLAEANMSQMPAPGMSSEPRAADFGRPPIGPPLPPPPPTDQPMARPSPVASTAASPTAFVSEQFGAPPPPKRDLVPITPGAATQQGPGGLSDTDAATKAFLAGEFAPRGGGPVKRIPAHDERAAFNIKYRDVTQDPQLAEDIGESRIDQQLATQEGAEQAEYGKSVQARLAANNASTAQRELERTLVRKNTIEQEVGNRIQGIDARIAKARAVTESGSARERVMKDKGWFGRILATIGVAMGAFAAGQTGGRNLVQEQIDKEVNEEMEREKQLYNVDPERSALKDLVESWGTPQGAQKEYELHLRESTLAKMEAWSRRADAASVPVEFRQWLADQALQVQQAKAKLHEDAAAEVTEQWRHVPDKVFGGGAARPDPLKVMQRTAQFREAYEKATGQSTANMKPRELEAVYSRSLRTPSGEMAFAPDQKRAQETEAQLGAINIIRQNLAEIRSIMKKPASEVNLADRERLRVLVQSNTTVGKEAEKLGALSGPDMGLIAPLSGEQALRRLNPANPDVAILAGLDAAEKHFGRKETAAMRGVYRDPTMRTPFSSARPSTFKEGR